MFFKINIQFYKRKYNIVIKSCYINKRKASFRSNVLDITILTEYASSALNQIHQQRNQQKLYLNHNSTTQMQDWYASLIPQCGLPAVCARAVILATVVEEGENKNVAIFHCFVVLPNKQISETTRSRRSADENSVGKPPDFRIF